MLAYIIIGALLVAVLIGIIYLLARMSTNMKKQEVYMDVQTKLLSSIAFKHGVPAEDIKYMMLGEQEAEKS